MGGDLGSTEVLGSLQWQWKDKWKLNEEEQGEKGGRIPSLPQGMGGEDKDRRGSASYQKRLAPGVLSRSQDF